MANIAERSAQMRAMWSDTPWEEVAAFIGPNADKFRAIWDKQRTLMLNKGRGIAWGFSWPVFFTSFVWFFYRKQWLIGAVLILLPIVVVLLMPRVTGAMGGIGIALAMMSHSLYLQDSMARIAKIRTAMPVGAERNALLASTGGVSRLAAGISGAFFALSVIGLFVTIFT